MRYRIARGASRGAGGRRGVCDDRNSRAALSGHFGVRCSSTHERVLVLYHFFGRGKASGLELGQVRTQAAHVFHVREGQVIKLVIYLDRDRAFADLGLTPEAGLQK